MLLKQLQPQGAPIPDFFVGVFEHPCEQPGGTLGLSTDLTERIRGSSTRPFPVLPRIARRLLFQYLFLVRFTRPASPSRQRTRV